MVLQGRRILLAVSGGIAAYKIPFLVRLLRQSGAEVRVAMTPAAEEFVAPLTLAALSGQPVERHLVLQGGGRTSWNNHVHLAEWAEALVVAPATSNTLAKPKPINPANQWRHRPEALGDGGLWGSVGWVFGMQASNKTGRIIKTRSKPGPMGKIGDTANRKGPSDFGNARRVQTRVSL